MSFWKHANDNPAKIALVDPVDGEISRGALLASANRLVHGLRAMGLGRGDTIAVLLPNGRTLIELYLAAAQAGMYITPINTHLAPPEVAYIVDDCDAKVFVAAAQYADLVSRADFALPADRRFAAGGALEGFRPYAELARGQPESNPGERKFGLVMTYTSGTTGRPRGVRRPTGDVDPETAAAGYAGFLSLFGIMPGSSGVHLVVSPLYHTAVLNFCTNFLHLGHAVVLMEKWSAEDALELIQQHRVTSSHMVPTQFRRLLALPEETKRKAKLDSLSHVIHSAAPCPIDTKRRMLDWWGPVIFEYYAASEGGGTLATAADWLAFPGTVGKAWPNSQIRILDDAGQPCAPGVPGTVYIRMGQHEFAYHKDRDKTQNAWRDGFFTVGDVGYLNPEGYLFLCDRKVDMIISGGVNIYPAEIESALAAHPAVADAAVFGIPDEDWGEQVKAIIEPLPGHLPSPELEADILSFLKERLGAYKCPRSIGFIPELPRDENGKLSKRKLKEPYWRDQARMI
jgi:long-chain acyl-CoA synthetase